MNGEDILPRELTSPVPRRGKWTAEEERYTEKIIFDFEHGTLDVPEGTTLRTLLSKVLNCDPMRITKKYTGNCSIGKRTFVPLVRTPENAIFMDMSQQDLRELRVVWISKLLLMEQWNNRKINLMKAHMGMGMGNIYADHLNNTVSRDHHSIGNVSSSSSGGGGVSGSTLNNGSSISMGASGAGSTTGLTSTEPGNSAGTAAAAGSPAGEGYSANSKDSSSAGVAPQFQELTLRLLLEPYVASAAEMDYLIKWLKTLFYVLVDRTISAADLDHSMFVGSISLPALIAIFRSRCIEHNPRLSQVHGAIEAYLRQLRINIPSLQSFPAPTPALSSVPAGGGSAPTALSRTESTEAADSSDAEATAASAEQKEEAKAAVPRTQSTLSVGSAASATEGLLLTSLSSLQPVPLPVLSAPSVGSPRSSSSSSGAGASSSTSIGGAAASLRTASNGSAVSVPEIESTIRHQSVFSQLPEHLKAYLTEVNKVAESSKQSTTTSSASAQPGGQGTRAGAEESAAGKAMEPTAAGNAADARYSAELQALSFAQQQARAIATAQAQAKALAESYRYPLPRRDAPPLSLSAVKTEAGNKAALANAQVAEARSAEEIADQDDHLLQYHKALVQSMAAKKSAAASVAAAALNQSRQTSQQLRGKPGVRTAPVPVAATAAVTHGTASHSQKRRKLADYTDMYMSAMHNQEEGAADASAPTGSTMYPSYEKQFIEHQRRMAAEDAAAEENEAASESGSYEPPSQQQLSLLTAMKDLYPPAGTVASPLPGLHGKASTGRQHSEERTGPWLVGTGSSSSETSNGASDAPSALIAPSSASRASSSSSSAPAPSANAPMMPHFPYGMLPGAMDPYAYQMQQMYGSAWPYGMPPPGYMGHQSGMMPQLPGGAQGTPPGLPGVSHAQIQHYLAGLSGNYGTDPAQTHYAQPSPTAATASAAGASSAPGAGGSKLTLDEWLRAMQQQTSRGMDPSMSVTSAAVLNGGRHGFPGHPGYHPGLYPGDPSHMMMLSALSNQGRYPPPAGYPPDPALYHRHAAMNPYLQHLRAGAAGGGSGSGPGGAEGAGAYPPGSADLMGYNALLNAGMSMSLPPGYREQAAAQALSAAAASSTGNNGDSAREATSAAAAEDAESGTAGGHSAAAEALLRLLNN